MQVLWSGKAFLEENRKIYSHGHTIAEVLKEPVQQGKKIYGLQYSVTAILPYFEKNIFANFPNEDESFYHWIDQRENPQTTEENIRRGSRHLCDFRSLPTILCGFNGKIKRKRIYLSTLQ